MLTETIIVKGSRPNLLWMFFGCSVFVGAGVLMSVKSGNNFLQILFGGLVILFFGAGAILFLIRLLGSKACIIITSEGIFDKHSLYKVGFVPWKDVIEIEEIIIANQKFISVVVKNPDEYIEKQRSVLNRRLMAANLHSFDSVIFISTNTLKMKHEQVYETIVSCFETYKKII